MKKLAFLLLTAFLLLGIISYNNSQLDKRESELSQIERNLQLYKNQLTDKAVELYSRENYLLHKVDVLYEREQYLSKKESKLLEVEKDLQQREKDIINKEYDLLRYEKDLQQLINEIPEEHDAIYVPQDVRPITVGRAQYIVRSIYRKARPESISYLDDGAYTCNEIAVVNN